MGEPERILVVRLSALGDVLTTIPAFQRLRASFPRARFGWLVEAPFAPLLAGLPGLETVIPLRTRRWRREPFSPATRADLLAARRALRDFDADLAVDLQGTWKSAVATRISGAPVRFGLGPGDLREPPAALLLTDRAPAAPAAPRSVVLRGLVAARAVATRFGRPDGETDERPGAFALHLPRDPEGTVAAFVASLGGPFALLQPGAGWRNKEWGAGRWGALARELATRHGRRPVVAWGPGEEALAAEVVAASGGEALAAPPTTLPELAALALAADVVAGGDTGPVHLAAALGRPTVAILGPTVGAVHGPWGPSVAVVETPLDCRPCNRRFASRKPCLDAIAVESVRSAVAQWFP